MPKQVAAFPLSIAKVGIGLFCLLVGIGWALEKSAEKEAERSPASPQAPRAEASPLLFRPEAKHRYTYSFRRKIDLRGLGSNVPSIAYSGKFTLDVLTADKNGFTGIAQAKVAEYSGKEPPLVRVRLDAQGKKIALQTAKISDEETLQYLAVTKDLLSLWDFPADADTLGKYEFRIEDLPTQAKFQIQKKTKVKYLTQPQTEIISSTHWLRWDNALAFPAEIKGDESTRMGRSGANLETITSYHLRFEARTASPAYTNAQLASLKQPETLALAQGKASDQSDYAKVDWPTLVEQLKRLDTVPSGERLAAFGDLARFLRREPGALAKVLGLLNASDIRQGADSTLFKTVVGALATAGSAEDQKALLAIYQNPDCPISGKGTILGAFTTTQAAPSTETVDFLRDQMQDEKNADLSQGASYALGSSLQKASGASADSAMASLRAQWQSAVQRGDLGAQLSLLDAIGNSGRAEFVPDLKNLVESQAQIALRAKAAFSLRFMNTGESTAVLVSHFADPSEPLRESVVRAVALAAWTEQFRNPLQACASHESVSRIQKECDELLRSHSQMAGN